MIRLSKKSGKLIRNKRKIRLLQLLKIIGYIYLTLSLTLLVILDLPQGIDQIYNKIFYKSVVLKNLSTLKAGENFSFFKEKLGSPVITRMVEVGGKNYQEDIFKNKYYYLQTITAQDGTVNYFSITITDSNFNPKYILPNYTINDMTGVEVILGKTKLSDIDIEKQLKPLEFSTEDNSEFNLKNTQSGYSLLVGAHTFNYFERYYIGNPGNYQTFYIGKNWNGPPVFDCDIICGSGSYKGQVQPIILAIFRKYNTINTYGETSPFATLPITLLGIEDTDAQTIYK